MAIALPATLGLAMLSRRYFEKSSLASRRQVVELLR